MNFNSNSNKIRKILTDANINTSNSWDTKHLDKFLTRYQNTNRNTSNKHHYQINKNYRFATDPECLPEQYTEIKDFKREKTDQAILKKQVIKHYDPKLFPKISEQKQIEKYTTDRAPQQNKLYFKKIIQKRAKQQEFSQRNFLLKKSQVLENRYKNDSLIYLKVENEKAKLKNLKRIEIAKKKYGSIIFNQDKSVESTVSQQSGRPNNKLTNPLTLGNQVNKLVINRDRIQLRRKNEIRRNYNFITFENIEKQQA